MHVRVYQLPTMHQRFSTSFSADSCGPHLGRETPRFVCSDALIPQSRILALRPRRPRSPEWNLFLGPWLTCLFEGSRCSRRTLRACLQIANRPASTLSVQTCTKPCGQSAPCKHDSSPDRESRNRDLHRKPTCSQRGPVKGSRPRNMKPRTHLPQHREENSLCLTDY